MATTTYRRLINGLAQAETACPSCNPQGNPNGYTALACSTNIPYQVDSVNGFNNTTSVLLTQLYSPGDIVHIKASANSPEICAEIITYNSSPEQTNMFIDIQDGPFASCLDCQNP
mgnify:FL=1